MNDILRFPLDKGRKPCALSGKSVTPAVHQGHENGANKILTFGELVSMTNSSAESGKLPNPAQIRKNKNEEVFLESKSADASIILFKSGKVIYERDSFETATTLDRCAKLTFYLHPSHDEEENGSHIVGCKNRIIHSRGLPYLASVIPYEQLADVPWQNVISFTCEPQLARNQESREQKHIELHLGTEDLGWLPRMTVRSAEDEFFSSLEDEML